MTSSCCLGVLECFEMNGSVNAFEVSLKSAREPWSVRFRNKTVNLDGKLLPEKFDGGSHSWLLSLLAKELEIGKVYFTGVGNLKLCQLPDFLGSSDSADILELWN